MKLSFNGIKHCFVTTFFAKPNLNEVIAYKTSRKIFEHNCLVPVTKILRANTAKFFILPRLILKEP